MIRALFRAFAQLSDPASRRVIGISLLAAATLYALLAAVVWWALFHTTLTGYEWVDWALDAAGGLVVLVLAWFLFPATVGMVSGLLLEDVVQAAEARHYPHLPPPLHVSLWQELGTALRFFLLVAVVNLLALPLYIATPGLNIILFYGVNGYLLGREYFEMVAVRRLGKRDARLLRRSHPLKPFSAGVIIAFLSTIPFLNLLVPVIASAFMVHVLQSMRAPLRPAG
ncbi:EI24 domain-containing protein [Azospirillum sp. SYSU D00513]|uniref:EI24 domain-containing protein n=1 Tax=Azospirillum sp. SYSU D00513 TaxID=2812561 RepID=UPI0020004E63|nr:EI24 domain-containing protein [Azospirillum sp. SYSU D00513]